MSQPPAPADPENLGTTDPFSAEALRVNQGKLITSEVERRELSSEIEQLRSEGFVILPRQISGDTLERMRDALDEINRSTRLGIHEFEGYSTHRAYCTVAKTLAFDELVMNRSVLAIIEGYFGESPQLSASMGITIYEGQKAQPLHRDSGHYPLPWPHPPLEVNSIWAFDDFCEDNGATRYVPQSHLMPAEKRPETPPLIAEMPAGSVLIYDGALWHGGGESTAAGARRRCLNNLFTRQWLRQQDNMYLSVTPERVLNSPKLMQRLLGYWIYGTTLGVLNGEAPLGLMEQQYGGKAENQR
jgi:ectoine hydroxylase-related dioxygenase (phytanoyl-CoA dioxygenase family)